MSFPSVRCIRLLLYVVNLTAQEADKLPSAALIDMQLSSDGGLDVNLKVGLNEYNKRFDKLPAVLPTNVGTFGFTLKRFAVKRPGRRSKACSAYQCGS